MSNNDEFIDYFPTSDPIDLCSDADIELRLKIWVSNHKWFKEDVTRMGNADRMYAHHLEGYRLGKASKPDRTEIQRFSSSFFGSGTPDRGSVPERSMTSTRTGYDNEGVIQGFIEAIEKAISTLRDAISGDGQPEDNDNGCSESGQK